MIGLNCPYCGKEIRVEEFPRGPMACPECGLEFDPATLQTSPPGTDIPALSPTFTELAASSKPAAGAIAPGVVLGQYRVDRFIGKGGMGAVFEGTHLHLQRKVAIKVLPADLAADREFVARFKREAMALARLRHPNIVDVHDMGETAGQYYFVMEYVDGVNLRHMLSHKLLSAEQALAIVPRLCEALEYAHGAGVVHRDIKPENILIGRDGTPKIADFGLAKLVKGESSVGPLTQTNVVMGTADYMAPEQREGSGKVDHRADIYSLGVVLYEMLTGELPMGRFPLPSKRVQVDVRIDDVVLKALEREPERRYQRASAMGKDVTDVVSSPSMAPVIPVLDLSTGRQMASARSAHLLIDVAAAGVTLASWRKNEIGYTASAPLEIQETPDGVRVHARGLGQASIYFPENARVEVDAAQQEVRVDSMTGDLTVRQQTGDVRIERFEGRLRVQQQNGAVAVGHLTSADFEIENRSGSVALASVYMTGGTGSVRTTNGRIDVRVDAASSIAYEATSGAATVDCRLGEVGEKRDRYATGKVGGGEARLRVNSQNGAVSLHPAGRARDFGEFMSAVPRDFRVHWSRMPFKLRKEIGTYVIVCAALFLFFGIIRSNSTAAWMVTIFWGMAIGIRAWTHLMARTTTPLPPPPIPPAPGAAGLVPPVPAVAGAPEPPRPPEPPPAPAARRPRFPFLGALSILFTILAFLTAIALAIVGAIDAREFMAGSDGGYLHFSLIPLSMTAAGLAVLGLLTGLGALTGTWEAPERIRGGRAAAVSVVLALVTMLFAIEGPRRHLLQTEQNARAALAQYRGSHEWTLVHRDEELRILRVHVLHDRLAVQAFHGTWSVNEDSDWVMGAGHTDPVLLRREESGRWVMQRGCPERAEPLEDWSRD